MALGDGTHKLPVKADIRRTIGKQAGDTVTISDRNREGQAELSGRVRPPRVHRETGGGQLAGHALAAELGRYLGPHLLAVGELDREPDTRQVNRLRQA